MLFERREVASLNHFRLWIGKRSTGLIMICLVIALLVSLLYINSLGNQFTDWDDSMIYANPEIQSLGWDNILSIFTPKKGATYQPIRVLSYAVDYHFWELNPLGYHVTNIFFYILTCIMVYFTLFHLSKHLREKAPLDSHGRVAFFGSLLFAAHPVHVEAVTWLAARKEVLQGFFFFLGFYLYLKAREEDGRRAFYLSLVVLSVFFAILSKPSAVIFPGVIFIYEIARQKEGLVSFFKSNWVFLSSSLALSAIFTFILLKVMVESEGLKQYLGDSISSNFLVCMHAFLQNIKLLLFTINYSAAYAFNDFFVIPPVFDLKNILLSLITVSLIGISVYSLRRTRVIFFFLFFFIMALLPYLNIIPTSTLKADRYVFIASFSYASLMGIVFDRLYAYRHKKLSKGFFKYLSMAFLSLLLIGYSWMTVRQNTVWRDRFTLWSDAVEKEPGSRIANAKMGGVYMQVKLYREAVKYLENAVQLVPWDYASRNDLGIAYGKLGEPEKALKEFMTAISLRPEWDQVKLNLSLFYQEQKKYKKAEEILKLLLSKNPHNADFHYRLGFVYKDAGQYEAAVAEFIKSVEIDPTLFNAYIEIGNIYAYQIKDLENAKYYFSRGTETESRIRIKR